MVKCGEFSFILRPSSLAGIGVFAVHDIPSGTLISLSDFLPVIRKKSEIPEEFLNYCVFYSEDECLCPERFDRMEIGWYLNHSTEPNIIKVNHDDLVAMRDIQAGEEVLMNYREHHEPDHLRESFYQEQSSSI